VEEVFETNETNKLPIISTVILNYNRPDLLETTVESYIKTIEFPYELIIIDNGSTDNSKQIINDLLNKHKNKINKVILLEKNIGGEAINIGLSNAKGKLLHINENDIEYLPHWSSIVIKLFNVFENLGQLSLFSPVPTDEEIWQVKPIEEVLYKEGEIIYKAKNNVGITSVIRREIWDKGIRIHTIITQKYLFPDDARLSNDIKKLGYYVAWSPHYLVKNQGHTYQEFLKRTHYYLLNYESKEWIKIDGLIKNINYWKRKVKPDRNIAFKYSFDSDIIIQPEMSDLFFCHSI
jgi:glycosyltransferase involved in cell wall biosynthesis